MFYLMMAIFCSTSISLILKYNDSKSGNPIVLLSANYFMATLIGAFFFFFDKNANFSFGALIFGFFMGIIFVVSFFSFAKSVQIAGAVLSAVSSRLSLLIPTLLSILFFNEIPHTLQTIGILLALTTLVFFYFSLKNLTHISLNKIDFFYLFFLLIGIGMGNFGLKVFQSNNPPEANPFFLFSIFFFSFLFTIGILIIKKIRFEKKTFFSGLILGVPNIFSSFFLLKALAVLSAIIVYPSFNIGIIVLTSILVYFIWNEKLNLYGKISLLFGISSIALLNL